MPYKKKKELPDNVKDNLPDHAQDIYIAAFNSAYQDIDDEAEAHAIAWSAVKRTFKKNKKGNWIKKEKTKKIKESVDLFMDIN
ncbi:MAG: ChaB family protein [Candidatus Woesearchaeota archaeon]